MQLIKPLIDEYLRTFPTEGGRLNSLLDLCNRIPEPQIIDPKQFVGHITASGLVLSPCKTKVLLLENTVFKMRLQPGGQLTEGDESPLCAAIRIVQKVIGQTSLHHLPYHTNPIVPIDIDTHAIPANKAKKEANHWHHDFRYLFAAASEEVFLGDAEYRDPTWVKIEELERYYTFSIVAMKIKQIVSREFRVKFFYDAIIQTTTVSRPVDTIVVSHLIPDAVPYLDALARLSNVVAVIPKPRSIVPEIDQVVSKRFRVERVTRSDSSTAVRDLAGTSLNSTVLLDIGGYFAEVAEVAGHAMPLGIVEDTENGHQRYEIVRGLTLPVLSVARSPLKNNEDFLIGQSVLFSADAILRDMGELIQYMRIGILGFGKIGRSILQHLLQRNVFPMVYDTNSVRRLEAYTGGASIPEPAEILREANVLFCATGSRSLNIFRFRDLRPGCFVFSVTSSDDEMDLSFLESEYKTEKITPHVTRYYNFYNHFFLVNRGNAVNFIHKAVVGDFIHLVKAEMLCCLGLLSGGKLKPGLQEATSTIRKTVASEWINHCVLRSYGENDA